MAESARHKNDMMVLRLLESSVLYADLTNGKLYRYGTGGEAKEVAGSVSSKGYLRGSMMLDGKFFQYMLHRAIWIACHGVPEDAAMEINHKNGDKRDNRIDNIELVSGTRNVQHAYDTGLHPKPIGEAHPGAKLTQADVDSIRAEYRPRTNTGLLAKRFGVTPEHIRRVAVGEGWQSNG